MLIINMIFKTLVRAIGKRKKSLKKFTDRKIINQIIEFWIM